MASGMSGLGTCRDCNAWIYWGEYQAEDGSTKRVPYDEPGYFTMHWQTCAAAEYVTVGRHSYKVERCKKCQHRVYWETTRNGRKRSMDCYLDEDTTEWVADGYCHFETCVGARTTAGSTNNWRAHDRPYTPPKQTAQQSPSEVARLVRMFGPDLGLTWPCTRVDITSAFRQQALKHHPDMGGQAKDFIKVKRAYDALKDLVPA